MLEHTNRGPATGAIDPAPGMQKWSHQIEAFDPRHRVLRQIRCRTMTAGLIEVGSYAMHVAAHHAVGHVAGMIERSNDRALDDVVAGQILDEFLIVSETAIAHFFLDFVPTRGSSVFQVVRCKRDPVQHAFAPRHARGIVDAFVAARSKYPLCNPPSLERVEIIEHVAETLAGHELEHDGVANFLARTELRLAL